MTSGEIEARVRGAVREAALALDERITVTSIGVTQGWGDINYVVIRAVASDVESRDAAEATLRDAVAEAAGDLRTRASVHWTPRKGTSRR